MGGFELTAAPDVYKRWLQFGLLSTHSRLHGSTSYRVPWVYDEESVDVVRFFTRLKLHLLPYLYSSAVHTSETGVPMMRSMMLEFEEDMNCRYLDKQYMLGDSLLVSPVFNEEGIAQYYLPQGKWTNLLTKEVSEGGCWRREHHDYLSVPLWVRENSMIAQGIEAENASYSFKNNLELQVFELQTEAKTVVYQNGRPVCSLSLKKNGEKIEGVLQGEGNVKIRFVNRKLRAVQGADVKIDGNDTVITMKAGEFVCEV